MVLYLDVLWVQVFVCIFLCTRINGVFFQKKTGFIQVLFSALAGSFTECLFLVCGLSLRCYDSLLWNIGGLLSGVLLSGGIAFGIRNGKWKMALGNILAAILLSGGVFSIASLFRISPKNLGTGRLILLAFTVGITEEQLLRLLCRKVWNRRLSYGVVLMHRSKNYFYRGYCDTGNFLRDDLGKGVWILQERKFSQLESWNPEEIRQITYRDASGERHEVPCLPVERVWLTGTGETVKEFADIIVAKGGGGFHGNYDMLLPYDVIWKV